MKGHNVCRALVRGPMLWGLPVNQMGGLLASTSLGFFLAKSVFGIGAGYVWLVLNGIAYGVLSFLAGRDPMYLTILLFHLTTRFYPKLNSYEVSQKRVVWR